MNERVKLANEREWNCQRRPKTVCQGFETSSAHFYLYSLTLPLVCLTIPQKPAYTTSIIPSFDLAWEHTAAGGSCPVLLIYQTMRVCMQLPHASKHPHLFPSLRTPPLHDHPVLTPLPT